MKARYRYRCYPTPAQQLALAKLFGCTRVVWNDALAHCNAIYRAGGKKPSNAALQKQFITQAKKVAERAWLAEVSNVPLQQSLNDLQQAYENFFKSCTGERKGKAVKPPRFKKRRAAQSARFTTYGFKLDNNILYLAKIGNLDVVWSRSLPSEPSSVTIIRDAAHRYFVSFVVEIHTSTPLGERSRTVPATENSVGIDLGITTFATLSNGEKINAPLPLKKRIKRVRRLDKNLSRKKRGSKRYEKAQRRRARLYAKLKDTRTDFLHKLSNRLIRENQAIALEDLNVSGMVKNRKLSKAISDLGWRQFRTFLDGKAQKYGREFHVISRWEPTSQRCSCCGEIGGKKELSVREWTCFFCGAIHDRDINAAVNIKACVERSRNERSRNVAGGHQETQNERGGEHQTGAKPAASVEALTHWEPIQLTLDLFG